MQQVSRILPPAYVFEGLRAIVAGGHGSSAGLAAGGALAGIDIVIAVLFFQRIYRQAVRTGLIARYSAESVG
jgi:ABC-2 type transport system permease protein